MSLSSTELVIRLRTNANGVRESRYSAAKLSQICCGLTSPPRASVNCWMTLENSICSRRGRSSWCSDFIT